MHTVLRKCTRNYFSLCISVAHTVKLQKTLQCTECVSSEATQWHEQLHVYQGDLWRPPLAPAVVSSNGLFTALFVPMLVANWVPFCQNVTGVVSTCVVFVLSHSIAMEAILPIICKVSTAALWHCVCVCAPLTCVHLSCVHHCGETELFYTESMILHKMICRLQKSLKIDFMHKIVSCAGLLLVHTQWLVLLQILTMLNTKQAGNRNLSSWENEENVEQIGKSDY